MTDDPRLEGYEPLEYFRQNDSDRSSRRIRDMPYGKRGETGMIRPSEMNFGTVVVDTVSPPQTVLITNTGYEYLPINNVSVVGDFLIEGDYPSSLAPDQIYEMTVSFTPKREGIITGGIYFDTGNAAGDEFVKLEGTGGPLPD